MTFVGGFARCRPIRHNGLAISCIGVGRQWSRADAEREPPRKRTMSLLDTYGMDDAEQRQRQAFLDLTDTDAANVRDLRFAFQEQTRTFAERFYEHLLRHPQTAALLQDPRQLEHLKTLQTDYFAQLLDGVFDAAYFEGRLRVGLAHQQVGLEPVWYLGAYNQYIQLTFPVFARAFGNNLEKVLPLLLSLVKVIFLDIGLALGTYFKKATEELRKHNTELRQALELYWQSLRREEQLRHIVSHEVRGGLAAIIASLEDLTDTAQSSLGPAALEQLDRVTHRGWSLSSLLDEMLSQAKESGAGWVDTAPIFETLTARFDMYAEGRSIQLVLPENAPRVWADPFQLREVFANLVANAVRYLDKEPGRVEITCQADENFCVFSVRDNGPGISPELRPHLFEPFVRGRDTPGKPAGTGLGLSFVRTAVEQGGGRVWVESTPGQGSRFFFTVPRVPPRANHSESSQLPAEAKP